MKSIKPGRGPSKMNAIGSIISIVFGVIWTISVISMGAPAMFPLFGVLFIVMGVANTIYHSRNATGENRYSLYDITDDQEEPDPLNQRFAERQQPYQTGAGTGFCPYCGRSTAADYEFCPGCGKKLPD